MVNTRAQYMSIYTYSNYTSLTNFIKWILTYLWVWNLNLYITLCQGEYTHMWHWWSKYNVYMCYWGHSYCVFKLKSSINFRYLIDTKSIMKRIMIKSSCHNQLNFQICLLDTVHGMGNVLEEFQQPLFWVPNTMCPKSRKTSQNFP